MFTSSVTLPGVFGSVTGNNALASKQSGEPAIDPVSIGRTVWYSWTAPESGSLRMMVSGPFTPQVGIYTGTSVGALNLAPGISGNEREVFGAVPFHAVVPVVKGITYRIAVDGSRVTDLEAATTTLTYGSFNLFYSFTTLELLGPATGSEFAEGKAVTVLVSEPLPEFDGRIGDVWLQGQTPSRPPNQWLLKTDQPFAVTNLPPGVYTFSLLATNSDDRVLVSVPVTFAIRPLNDHFSNRLIMATATDTTACVSGSSLESGEQARWEPGVVGSVWWEWIAPSSGRFAVSSSSSVRVFTGTSLSTLASVASSPEGHVTLSAVAERRYLIAAGVQQAHPADAIFDVDIRTDPVPVNDRFGGAVILEPESTLVYHNYGATRENGEPNLSGSYGSGSVWFSFTAPDDGVFSLNLTGSSSWEVIGAYTGTVVSSLTMVTNSTQGGFPLVVPANRGMTYHLSIASAIPHHGILEFRFWGQPTNDFFADRIRLAGESVVLVGANYSATRELDEPVFRWGGLRERDFTPEATLWWEWSPLRSGFVQLTSSGQDVALAGVIWRGTELTNLMGIMKLELLPGAAYPVLWPVTAGETYQFCLGTQPGERGRLGLQIEYVPQPPNDNFAQRVRLHGDSFHTEGTGRAATMEAGEPGHEHPSAWYSWTAPHRARAVLSVNGTLGVYRGTQVEQLAPVIGGAGQVAFRAEPGVEYQIAVYSQSAFVLSLEMVDSPQNDDFTASARLEGNTAETPVMIRGATLEAGVPNGGADAGDLWRTWVPPWSGKVTLACPGASQLRVYGDSHAREESAPPSYSGVLTFQAYAGRCYRIQVLGGQELSTSLSISLTPPPLLRTVLAPVQAGAGFQFEVLGLPGQAFDLHVSENLRDWDLLRLHTFLGTNEVVSDDEERPRRFYKIVPLE